MIDSEPRTVRITETYTIGEGDLVRLKFLYPNGSIEVVEATWVAATSLGAPENPNGAWILVSVDDQVLWKPMAHLIQIEVLEANEASRRRGNGGDLGQYHR